MPEGDVPYIVKQRSPTHQMVEYVPTIVAGGIFAARQKFVKFDRTQGEVAFQVVLPKELHQLTRRVRCAHDVAQARVCSAPKYQMCVAQLVYSSESLKRRGI